MDELFTVVPLSPIRKVIAERMSEAQRTIPHFRLSANIELDALLALRKHLKAQQIGRSLSLNDLFIKACAEALMEVPDVNIQWVDGQIRRFAAADVAVVMALESGGLTTPIVRNAESKSVWHIAREIKELGARAASGALKMTEILGGTFSVSNLGMYGVDHFDAIINAPQCAILAVGAGTSRYVISAKNESRIATVLTATLSCDHRAIDGATAATFMAALRRRIEHPARLSPAEDN